VPLPHPSKSGEKKKEQLTRETSEAKETHGRIHLTMSHSRSVIIAKTSFLSRTTTKRIDPHDCYTDTAAGKLAIVSCTQYMQPGHIFSGNAIYLNTAARRLYRENKEEKKNEFRDRNLSPAGPI